MSNHERIASIVIVDLNSRSIKAGIAGRTTPEIELPIHFDCSHHQVVDSFPPQLELNDSALTAKQRNNLLNDLVEKIPYYPKLLNNYRHSCGNWLPISLDDQNIPPTIIQLLFEIWFDHLQLTPKTCQAVLVDNEYPTRFKHQITKGLLDRLRLRSVSFIPASILTIMGSNRRDGLVLNFEWNELRIYKIIDLREVGRVFIKELSGERLHFEVVLKLIELESEHDIEFDVVDKLIHQESQFSNIREEVLDRLYFSNTELIRAIKQTIKESPIDIRNTLMSNIVISGELSTIPRFKENMVNCLTQEFPKSRCFPTVGAWTGCSLYVDQCRGYKQITKDTLNELYKAN